MSKISTFTWQLLGHLVQPASSYQSTFLKIHVKANFRRFGGQKWHKTFLNRWSQCFGSSVYNMTFFKDTEETNLSVWSDFKTCLFNSLHITNGFLFTIPHFYSFFQKKKRFSTDCTLSFINSTAHCRNTKLYLNLLSV